MNVGSAESASLLTVASQFLYKARSRATEHTEGAALVGLIGVGAVTELLIIFAILRPFSLVAHPQAISVYEPFTVLLGPGTTAIGEFIASVTVAAALYLLAFAFALRVRGSRSVALILFFSALFSITLMLTYPPADSDTLSYILDGRMAWIYGLNPMAIPRTAASSDIFFSVQQCCANLRSTYGPVWQLLTFIPTRLAGDGFASNEIAFRVILLPFLTGSAYLASRIAGARDVRLAPAAALFVGWSPLLLWEVAANGHNDIVLCAFALFALERAQHRSWTAAFALLTVSVLAKYVTVLLVPLFVLAVWRAEGKSALWQLAKGALVSVALVAVLFLPFWDGPSSLVGLAASSPQAGGFAWSPAWFLAVLLHGSQPLPLEISASGAGQAVRLMSLALFAIAYAVIVARLWRGRDSLPAACLYCLFFYLMFVAWFFLPWYVSPVVAIGGCLVFERPARIAMLFSITALLAHVVIAWREVLFTGSSGLLEPGTAFALVFALPFAYWIAGIPRPAWLASAFGQAAPAT